MRLWASYEILSDMARLDRSLISHFPFFQGMSDSELDSVLEDARSSRYPKDSVIFGEGQEAAAFFFLLAGHVRAVRTTPDGHQVIARYISPGEIFGIAPAIGRTTYPATAEAANDCVVISWPVSFWADFVQKLPRFAVSTYKMIGDRLQETQDHASELSTDPVEQRVAAALLRLLKQAGKETSSGIAVDFPVSRQDIAEMCGTTLHTVSRLFSAWVRSGLIEGGRQKVSVLQPSALEQIATGSRK